MDIIQMAKDLGQAIASSQQMEDLKKSELALENDPKAKQLFDDYKNLQIEMVCAVKEQKETIDGIREKLVAKQNELNEYPVTDAYIKAKSSFDSLIKTVNEVITFSITGEEPCSPKKCASCSGCG